MIYEKILAESKRLEKKINELQKQLDTFPEGKLISTVNTKGTKWYLSDGHKSIYLPKKERRLAEQLAHKKYLSLQLQNLLREQNAINFYLRHHDSNAHQAEQSFVNSLQYKDLLSPVFTPLSEELKNWMSATYERRRLLLGTFWFDGQSCICQKCSFKTSNLHFKRYYPVYSIDYNL